MEEKKEAVDYLIIQSILEREARGRHCSQGLGGLGIILGYRIRGIRK